jgi:hypothetical protein
MKAFGLFALISAGLICLALADPDRQLATAQPFSESPSPGAEEAVRLTNSISRARLQAAILKNIDKNLKFSEMIG